MLLVATALSIPLRIPEILQMAAVRDLSPSRFFRWIAQAPGSSPLNPILQVPALLVGGHSRLGARFVSLVFAVAACYFFLRLARRVPLDRPYWALLLFMLLPAHFELSFVARPFEQALFLVIVAMECFFRLLSRPRLKPALLYAGCLTLCLYTDRYSFLPSIGYLLFLFRFVDRAQERKATWYALGATALPVLLFLPYALWARTHVSAYWFTGPPDAESGIVYLRLLRSLAAERWASYVLFLLLTTGVVAGIWASFRVTAGAIGKRIRLFVLAGGIGATVVILLAMDFSLGKRFAPADVLWSAPAAVILVIAALEWLGKRRNCRSLRAGVTVLLFAVCAAADIQFLLWRPGAAPKEDVQAIATAIPGQLDRDSCVVFVSERFSRAMFLVFEPELASRECLAFFHSRIVLASHPYVTPEQQQDAESYFQGLNMTATRRLQLGGGQIVVMQENVTPAKQ